MTNFKFTTFALTIGLIASIPAQAEVEMIERAQDEGYLPVTYLAEQLRQNMECRVDAVLH
jgi:hypothetical protein